MQTGFNQHIALQTIVRCGSPLNLKALGISAAVFFEEREAIKTDPPHCDFH
jgi:hypothetical protein